MSLCIIPPSRGKGFKSLQENEAVEFEVTQGAKGLQAQNVIKLWTLRATVAAPGVKGPWGSVISSAVARAALPRPARVFPAGGAVPPALPSPGRVTGPAGLRPSCP